MKQPSLATLEEAARQGNELAQVELASQLIENRSGPEQRERGLSILRRCAEGSQGPLAQWVLGAFFLQHLALPNASEHAKYWLERAVGAGVAPAMERLANFHLRGVGIPRDEAKSVDLLRRLADAGFQRCAWELGYLLSQHNTRIGNTCSVTAFARACSLGYPPAYYSLGLRFALGSGAERDPAFARALLMRANDANYPDSLAVADEFAPLSECAGEQQGWYDALKRNHREAGPLYGQLDQANITIGREARALTAKLEAHFATIGSPHLYIDDNGRLGVRTSNPADQSLVAKPGKWAWLADKPRVALSDCFVSREERAHLMFLVSDSLSNPENYTSDTVNGQAENRFFNGLGQSMNALNSDSVVRTIEQRIASMTDWKIDALEPSSVIVYRVGQEYRPHVDYYSAEQLTNNRKETMDFGGQRMVTFLICLKAPAVGGETHYNRTGLTVSHATGQALLHYNVAIDGTPEPLSQHSGEPIQSGEKWLLRTTLRENSRYFRAD